MSKSETFAIPSPDECVGVVGLSISLVGLTIGITALLFLNVTTVAWAVVVVSLFVGWVSFLYCVAWGESTPGGDVWEE